ncbi:MAG: hypothetical protein IJ507_07425 [Clostridia bacterium]|nr:hypothetical protein [Clostridia bacterium]
MERFLRYSLERGRAIRLMYQEEDGRMRQVNAQVTGYGDGTVTFATLRPKREITLKTQQLLSADYRKGDEGQE